MLKFLRYMLQLVISPQNGWDDIAQLDQEPSELLSKGLFPLIGAASISNFAQLFYNTDATLVSTLQNAVITFIQFFVTYFLANLVFSTFLDRVASVDSDNAEEIVTYNHNDTRSSTFIIYTLGLLTLIALFVNLIPVELSILQFLPFCVALIMWKGCGFMEIPEKRIGHFVFIAVFSILVPTYLLEYFFKLLLY